MLASRQVLGNVARSRAFAGAASGIRRMATISDSPLDRKVSLILDLHIIRGSWFVHVCWRMWGARCVCCARSPAHMPLMSLLTATPHLVRSAIPAIVTIGAMPSYNKQNCYGLWQQHFTNQKQCF